MASPRAGGGAIELRRSRDRLSSCQAIGRFVGRRPFPVIAVVNLLTVFCAYGALSVQWPFVYNPYLNDNVLEGMDDGFAQQDGTRELSARERATRTGRED